VLAQVENQVDADHKAGGAAHMTKEKYDFYNATLDSNSAILHEEKNNFYYYGPYYNNYSYWD
jgi:hypothetical protein